MLATIFGLVTTLSSLLDCGGCGGDTARPDTLIRRRTHATDTLTPGRFLYINRIFILGNRITRDQIIHRELSLQPGEVIYEPDLASILDLDRKKLLNTRLFNSVEIRTLELDAAKIDLIVDLNERWYTFPAPLFELADRNFNEWWQNYDHDFRRVNYGLRLYQYNMRGRNETLRLHAQFGFQRRFELMYRFPYIDKKQKHGLAIDMGFGETKNVAVRTIDHKYEFLKGTNILRINRIAGISYSYRNSFYKTHSARIEYYNASIRDTLKTINPIYLKKSNEQSYMSLSYTFTSDRRDLVSYPLKGYHFQFIANRNGLLPGDDLERMDASLLYSNYGDLGKGYYVSNNLVGYASTPDNVSYMNFGVLGYRRQFVRGYEVYVIEGPYFALNKTTFKKLIFSQKYHWEDMPMEQFRHVPLAIYLKTYADFGYVKNYPDYETTGQNTRLSNKLLTGAGFGIDVVGSYDVVLRFEYSFNAEGQNGFFFHVRREF